MSTPTKLTEEQIKSNIEAYEAWLRNKNIELQYMRIGQTEWINWITNKTFSQDHGIIAIRIKPQPKLRPWKAEEVPHLARLRMIKWNDPKRYVTILGASSTQINCSEDLGWSFVLAYENCEHSLDGGKTWNPCGVME